MSLAAKSPAKQVWRSRAVGRTATQNPRLQLLRVNAYDLTRRIQKAALATENVPDVETVHRLRTGTRRCGALLESLLQDKARNALHAQQELAHKLLVQLKRLRRAAGSVRDLDVHLGLMKKLRKSFAEIPDNDAEAARQLDDLHRWLKEQRDVRARTLQAQAAKQLERIVRLTEEVLGKLPPKLAEPALAALPASTLPAKAVSARRQAAPALLALEDFYKISAVNLLLNRDNLHDFRKSAKQARYVAEAGGEEQHAVDVSRALKRIQDAIGDWHDLDALCLEARQALGHEGSALQQHLSQLAEDKLQQAIAATEKMRLRLLGERLAMQPRTVRTRVAK